MIDARGRAWTKRGWVVGWRGASDGAHAVPGVRSRCLRGLRIGNSTGRAASPSWVNTLVCPLVWGVSSFKNSAGRSKDLRSDLEMPTPGLNSLLASVFSLEGRPMARNDLAFGVSLICTAAKKAP